MRQTIRTITIAALVAACTATAGVAQAPRDTAITPARIALGDSIFHGQVAGGPCQTCHQANAKGMPGLAPDLTDNKWLHGDGSYSFIVATVQNGVPKPRQAAVPMKPRGGANLTDEQVKAVAAYVYALRTSGR